MAGYAASIDAAVERHRPIVIRVAGRRADAHGIAGVDHSRELRPGGVPPDDAEYSVVATLPVPLVTMTCPAVSCAASTELGDWFFMPGYVWQV